MPKEKKNGKFFVVENFKIKFISLIKKKRDRERERDLLGFSSALPIWRILIFLMRNFFYLFARKKKGNVERSRLTYDKRLK